MLDKPVIAAAAPVRGRVAAGIRSWAHLVAGADDEPLRRSEVVATPSAQGLLIESTLQIDEALLERLPALRVVSSASVGYDNIDLAACARHDIAVSNGRGALDDAVADLILALIIMSRRQMLPAIAWAKNGAWLGGLAPFARDVAGATLGIYGFGAIGLALAKRARVCGMRIEYANRRPRQDDATTGATFRDLPDLARNADILVILTPLTAETRKRFSHELLGLMKPSAYLINAARGGIVDTDALTEALAAGRLAGAALDVTDPEPLPPEHPLYANPNVIIVPHIGSATVETRERMSELAARNLAAFFRGEPLLTPIG
jgi:glyoxylate reductase